MDLTPYVENLRRELAVAADAGGEDARALAERLTAPLESAVRLMLLDALSAAADEITRELAPGSVELRLRAGEPDFVVTPAPADEPLEPAPRRARRPRRPEARRGRRPRASTSACPSSSRPASRRPRPRAAVRQRLARPRRRRRARARRPPPAAGAAAGRPGATPAGCADRASVRFRTQHHVFEPDPQEGNPMPTFDTPNRSRPRSTSPSATSGSPPATAATPSSRCAPATRPTRRTSRPPSRPASSTPTGSCWSRRRSCARWLEQARRVGRRDDRAARRLARARRARAGRLPLRRPARRLPDQDRPRPHPARPGRHART